MTFGRDDMGNYDAWKLDPGSRGYGRNPAYDDYDEPDCDCLEYDIDWDGTARCDHCGRTWTASPADQAAYLNWQHEFYEQLEREMERKNRWWNRLKGWLGDRLAAMRRPGTANKSDEIPF